MSTTQEENWELMSWLNMPWSDCKKLADDDRQFLLTKAEELKVESKKYYDAQAEAARLQHERDQPAGPTMSDGREVKSW
jgi:hypothetical protein